MKKKRLIDTWSNADLYFAFNNGVILRMIAKAIQSPFTTIHARVLKEKERQEKGKLNEG